MKTNIHHYSIMRKVSARVLALAALSCSLLQSSFAQNQYWDTYGNRPVLIEQVNNGASQTLKFVSFEDGMLVAELEGGVGTVALPVSESMVSTLRLSLDTATAYNMFRSGNYTGSIKLLRPQAYPLIKFAQVPETFTTLHVAVRTLIESLIRAGIYPEAEDILTRISLDKADIKYSQTAIELLNAYITAGDYDAAARLAQSIPVEGKYAANIRPIVDTADALRAAGQYDAVIPLYQTIETIVTEDARKNVRMWLAYSLVLADRLDEANLIIEKLEQPATKDRLFSLYQLLLGSRAHSAKDYSKALDMLTRGFVRAQTSYVWVPEMLFLIGDCYAKIEDNTAAHNVWTEIATLYPSSPWAARAEQSLEQLTTTK